MLGQFANLADLIHMGGYAYYVWPAYAIVVIVLMINIFIPIQQRRKLLQRKKS